MEASIIKSVKDTKFFLVWETQSFVLQDINQPTEGVGWKAFAQALLLKQAAVSAHESVFSLAGQL